MASHELVLPNGAAVPVGESPIGIGRGPANDVVLSDDSVSWHHAQVWVEGDAAWIRDIGSRNGTFVNGQRAVSAVRLTDGDRLQIGASVVLTLSGASLDVVHWRVRHVEDLATGVRVLVRGPRFVMGSARGSDLRIDDWPLTAATLIVHENGELWLATAEGEREVAANEPIDVSGRLLRVVERDSEHAPTVDTGVNPATYSLVTRAHPTDGASVSVTDPGSGREFVVTGNRGVLLFALARQWVRDREAKLAAGQVGWVGTEELVTAVWGRGGGDVNNLNVLVHRLRGQLTEEGLDPWFIEKRKGAVRVRVADVWLR
jgi:FHA domain